MNPWGLTAGQERAIQKLVEFGMCKVAAAKMGIAKDTMVCHMAAVKRKMKRRNLILCALEYDRWKRGSA